MSERWVEPVALDRALPRSAARVEVGRLAGRVSLPLVALVGVALLQGFLFLLLLPPWQHYDEPTHFEHAWLIAEYGEVPVQRDPDPILRREIAASMSENGFHWNLPPVELLADNGPINLGVTELSHPPAYYFLASLPLRLVSQLDVTRQLYVARAVSLLLFVLIVVVVAGIARDLVPVGHPLRWALPLTVVMLPSFASQMTAVNNDVAAVLVFSFFLWGALRLILRGPSTRLLLWVFGASLLAVATKSTAAVALLLAPVALLLSIWVARGWRWRWLLLAAVSGLAVVVVALIDFEDAAYWYRERGAQQQLSADRLLMEEAPEGRYAFRLELATDSKPLLASPLTAEQVASLAGREVTVGGWIWADRPGTIDAPGLKISLSGATRFELLNERIEVRSEPTLFLQRYLIPPETVRADVVLVGQTYGSENVPDVLYLDQIFLVPTVLDPAAEITIQGAQVVAGDRVLTNLVRNGSAEMSGPRVRSWLDRLLSRYGRRSPRFTVAALYDVSRSAPFLFGLVAPSLAADFFAAFAWGQVRVDGTGWRLFFLTIGGLGSAGILIWLVRGWRRLAPARRGALFLLGISAAVVWLNALVWPLPFIFGQPALPAGRYIYPSIVPIALILAGGWFLLLPRAGRGLRLFFLLLGILNVAAYVRLITAFWAT